MSDETPRVDHGTPRAVGQIWIDTTNGEGLKVVTDGWDYVHCRSLDTGSDCLVQPSHFGKTLLPYREPDAKETRP